MQERIRIQAHLEKLREDCVKDYLSSNLESIASRQVISDVLKSFLETNNKQFLESIADSILQAKQNNKSLRDALQLLEIDYQRLLDERSANTSIEIQRIHSKQIELLERKLDELKDQFKVQTQNYHKQIENLQLRIIVQQKEKQQLIRNLQQIRQSLKEQSELLKNKQQQVSIKDRTLKTYQQNTRNQMQKLQYRLKTSFLQKLQQQKKSKQLFIKQNTTITEEMLRKAESEKAIIISNNQQLKNQMKESKKQQQKIKQLWQSIFRKYQDSQKQRLNISNTVQTLRQQIFKYRCQSADFSNKNKHLKQRQQQLLIQISVLSNNLKDQRQSFEKRLEEILEQNHSLRLFNQQIVLVSKKNDSTLDEQAREIQILMKQHSQVLHTLETLKQQNLQAHTLFKEQKERLQALLRISQQQTKSLMNYNSMQQRQISKLQQQSLKIKQQSSAQMEVYQSTFQLNIKALQEQLTFQKEKCEKYQAMITQLQQQIEGERQKQKYYHSYLQQIALLKNKLQINELKKNKILYRPDSDGKIEKIDKRTRIFSMLLQISDKYNRLNDEHQKLKRYISEQLQEYKSYFKQLSSLLCNKIELTSKSGNLSDHIFMKTSPYSPKQQAYLNKATIKKGGSLKQQLKSVQERYQTINIQNRTFTSNISTLLSN